MSAKSDAEYWRFTARSALLLLAQWFNPLANEKVRFESTRILLKQTESLWRPHA